MQAKQDGVRYLRYRWALYFWKEYFLYFCVCACVYWLIRLAKRHSSVFPLTLLQWGLFYALVKTTRIRNKGYFVWFVVLTKGRRIMTFWQWAPMKCWIVCTTAIWAGKPRSSCLQPWRLFFQENGDNPWAGQDGRALRVPLPLRWEITRFLLRFSQLGLGKFRQSIVLVFPWQECVGQSGQQKRMEPARISVG